MLDDVWDEDGDGIGAVSEDAFLPDGHPIVNVEFPQGTDPQVVSRMLHKMARVLEGASRHQIANMQPADQARRIGDGEVDIVNLRELFKEYREDDAAQG